MLEVHNLSLNFKIKNLHPTTDFLKPFVSDNLVYKFTELCNDCSPNSLICFYISLAFTLFS